MKVCIVGAGAIGGFLGCAPRAGRRRREPRRARRASRRDARRTAFACRSKAREEVARLRCTDRPADLGVQDYVVIALKAHGISGDRPGDAPAARGRTRRSSRRATAFLIGISTFRRAARRPRARIGGPGRSAMERASVPSGRSAASSFPRRKSSRRASSGTSTGASFRSASLRASAANASSDWPRCSKPAGSRRRSASDIRDEIWLKLWGNLCLNPISALTCATVDVVIGDAGTRAACRAMMTEAAAIAERLGVRLRVGIDAAARRRRGARRAQDVDAAGSRARPVDGDRADRRRRAGARAADAASRRRQSTSCWRSFASARDRAARARPHEAERSAHPARRRCITADGAPRKDQP